uniref:Uncharacterized protein n=2 Tax=Picea TaxID=3328 RepID=A0A101LVH3_PICGL|nr:hypothetical protein ABT39_MTgene1910 [Picea glauca]QHR89895.1 hypothetical protein Q903MT_gene3917 [Picea sitchensis]
MTTGDTTTSQATLFTHNCHIKHVLATLILGNGSHKNLVAQDLVQCFSLPTNSNPSLYPLGWVHKDGPHLMRLLWCRIWIFILPSGVFQYS